jgi:hypothetical protein
MESLKEFKVESTQKYLKEDHTRLMDRRVHRVFDGVVQTIVKAAITHSIPIWRFFTSLRTAELVIRALSIHSQRESSSNNQEYLRL